MSSMPFGNVVIAGMGHPQQSPCWRDAPGGAGQGSRFWAFRATVKMAHLGVSAGHGDKRGKPEELMLP